MTDWQVEGNEGPFTRNQIKTIHSGKKNNILVIYIYWNNYTGVPIILFSYIFEEFLVNTQLFVLF
jgi:hypothetical protein